MGKYFNIEYIYIVISDVCKGKFREKSRMILQVDTIT